MTQRTTAELRIGWASADITPDRPVAIAGQFHARVSEGVSDPVTATALAIQSAQEDGSAGHAILVSCDLVCIPDGLRNAVRERVHTQLPEIDSKCICLNATHTHTGPHVAVTPDPLRPGSSKAPVGFGVSADELGVMDPAAYVAFAAERIADAAASAWQRRAPGGIGFGLGQAVIGRNRRMAYRNGESRMYGKTTDPEFSHIEGYEDHDVNLLCAYDANRQLTGMVINVACPSQVSENEYQISADYWHDTRTELRRRLGEGLFILPQCGAAGDQSPHVLINGSAEARMLKLRGLTAGGDGNTMNNNLGDPRALRKEIARRITDTVTEILPFVETNVNTAPVFAHRCVTIDVDQNKLSEKDLHDALEEAVQWEAQYEELRRELDAHPEKKSEPRWYVAITRAYRRLCWFKGVEQRFRMQTVNPRLPVELTVLRLGDVAIATNPFEFYVDYGMRIKAHSPACQTFVVQLAGTGTYLPTERALAGKSYGAVPASNPVGPEGGHTVVNTTLEHLAELWT